MDLGIVRVLTIVFLLALWPFPMEASRRCYACSSEKNDCCVFVNPKTSCFKEIECTLEDRCRKLKYVLTNDSSEKAYVRRDCNVGCHYLPGTLVAYCDRCADPLCNTGKQNLPTLKWKFLQGLIMFCIKLFIR